MSTSADRNRLLCDEKIYNKKDAKEWILKNHPDKRGDRSTPFDVEKFKLVKQAIDKDIYCVKNKTHKKRNSTRSTTKSETLSPENKDDPDYRPSDDSNNSESVYSSDDSHVDSTEGSSSHSKSNASKNETPYLVDKRKKIAECIRKRANWSNILRDHRFENIHFNKENTVNDMLIASPKIRQMLDTIERLDKEDLKTHGKLFKHFIYSDVKPHSYGAKILASSFIADGYVDLIKTKSIEGNRRLYLHKTLSNDEENKGFALLSSDTVYNTTYTQRLKKEVLNIYNTRPDNVHGKKMRFIILDSGFKEGIDLFDVKYVHILEPLLTVADIKQTIGRATRTCGQKGLHFQDGVGWEMFVYTYYLTIPEELGDAYVINPNMLNTKDTNEGKLFKNKEKIKDVLEEFSNDDASEKKLIHQLYNLVHPLSVDFYLTIPVHGDLKQDIQYRLFREEDSLSSNFKGLFGGAKYNALNVLNIKTINCVGRCGKRSTKDVPATVSFIEKVYKKYKYDNKIGSVPQRGKRAYFCDLMKKNADFCDHLNYEWANQLALVPFIRSEKDISNLEVVPPEPEDKIDYKILQYEPSIDKNEQKNAVELYKAFTPASDDSEFSYAPRVKMGYKAMRKHIQTYFSQFKYPVAKVTNKCIDKPHKDGEPKSSSVVIDYSPSQLFVSNFFTPNSAYKGMLLWHSVGTGKTCSAVATSSATFEKVGYAILWVTRHTLKSDVYKNIFDMICHHRIAEATREGEKIPDNLAARTRMISKNWIKPLSYKQFSNLLSGENEYYQELIERNGKKDILRKTLVIIDEAHKLYSGDLTKTEQPDMNILEKLIQHSYKTSGKDSVKLLIMTATPITKSPFELFKLLNLMIDEKEQQFPTQIDDFKKEYMNEDGIISEKGMTKMANQMAGYVSYLDRSRDASQFAQAIVVNVPVMMTHIEDPVIRDYIVQGTKPPPPNYYAQKRKILRQTIKNHKQDIRNSNKTYRGTLKSHKAECKDMFPSRKEKGEREECLRERKQRELEIHEEIVEELTKKISDLETEIHKTKEDVDKNKSLSKKLREVKKSLLQEIQIAKKCEIIT